MTTTSLAARPWRDPIGRLRRLGWFHPEWTVALLCAAGWVLVVLHHSGTPSHPPVMPVGMAHSGMDMSMGLGSGTPRTAPVTDWLSTQGHWLLMATAMMLPAALPAARQVAMNSKWRRRQRAIAVFAVTYLGVWLVFGILAG